MCRPRACSTATAQSHNGNRVGCVAYACIPDWYRIGMSKQIAVRLPEDIVDFVDALVSEGKASSRAAVVIRALERERRRAVAALDVAILARPGDDTEMDSLAEHVVRSPLDLE